MLTTPELWRHDWCPTMPALLVDDLGVECAGEEQVCHLIQTLEEYYGITLDYKGEKLERT